MRAVLGIDVGLSSVRAAVVAADGRLLGHARSSQPPLRGTGRDAERHVTDWTAAIPRVVRDSLVAAGSPPIEMIGIGALGPCPVMLDAGGMALGSVPLFSLEAGAEAERQHLLADGTIAAHLLGPDHVIPRLRLWQRQRPDEFARAVMVVDATGYLVGWLTGRPVMDPATAIDHRCHGLPQPLPLPQILEPTSIAGGLTPAAAELLGLPAATPVCVGTYDSFADLAGAGVVADGDAGLLLGTTAVVGKVVGRATDETAVAAAGLRATPHAGAGVLVGGWTSTSGSLVDWAGRLFPDTDQTEPPGPGASGLIALPYFAGERAPHWDVAASGAFVGLSLATTAGDLRRAAIEGVALSILDIADRIAAVAGAVPVVPGCRRRAPQFPVDANDRRRARRQCAGDRRCRRGDRPGVIGVASGGNRLCCPLRP